MKHAHTFKLSPAVLVGVAMSLVAFPRWCLAQKPVTQGPREVMTPQAVEKVPSAAPSKQRLASDAAKQEQQILASDIKVQDDVLPYSSCAELYALAGQYEKAIALLEWGMAIPAAPGAQPPGIWDSPKDYRGMLRWQMAGYHRAQGHWAEALALYQLNRETYPLDDGCVQTGVGYQMMALAEGECLERLGRYQEAVDLYWKAAATITSAVAPRAMRRLIDLYSATGQMESLEKAVQREVRALPSYYAQMYLGINPVDLNEDQREMVSRRTEVYAINYFNQLRPFREAIRSRNWKPLVAILDRKEETSGGTLYEYWRNEEGSILGRTEAISALIPLADLALPSLENKLRTDPENPYLKAAIMACKSKGSERAFLSLQQVTKDEDVRMILWDVVGAADEPLPLPAELKLQLSITLPEIYKVPMG